MKHFNEGSLPMKKACLLLLVGLMPAFSAGALAPEPAKIHGDFFEITPALKIGVLSDDNFYTEPSGAEDSSVLTTISPSVLLRHGKGEDNSQLAAAITGGFASEDSNDNFTDYKARFSTNNALMGNLALGFGLGVEQGHDARGSITATDACQVGIIVPPAIACDAEPDVWRDAGANLDLTFGRKASKGSLKLGARSTVRRFDNNAPRTLGLEYDLTGLTVKFGWKISGKTAAIFETNYSDYDYLTGFDNTAAEYLAGVEWAATGKFRGYAKAGLQEKKFSNPASDDISDSAWRVGLYWSPSKLNSLNLELARNYEESAGIGTAKIVTRSSLRAAHLLTERIEPYVRAVIENTDYQDAARTDDRDEFALGVDYKIRRFAVLGLSWTTASMSSDAGPQLEYDRNQIALTANFSL